jgi:hypothetical protein
MPRLQQAIDAMPASDHLTFLVTGQGKPFTAAGFGNWFRDRCRAAKLPERCTSHGLRKAAATYLAEQGATDHQLMAWFGWSSISQAQVYTKAANGKRMGRSAGKLISGTGIGSPIDPVSQNDDEAIENIGSAMSDPSRTRTCNPRSRNPLLTLWVRVANAWICALGAGTRSHSGIRWSVHTIIG